MTDKQPEALRLADALDAEFVTGRISNHTGREAAAELRRLHSVNAQLVAALNAMLTHMGMDEDEWNKPTFDKARAAIAVAKEQA